MKLVLVVVVLAGCFVDRRSGELACKETTDCESGRTCVDGYCVLDGAKACPTACTQAGGSCPSSTTCRFTCATGSSCASGITCPPGMRCEVDCNAPGACSGTVDCAAATSCRIRCGASNTCAGPVTCGSGECEVQCEGVNACSGGVSCADACACDVRCSGTGACLGGTECAIGGPCTTGNTCTSEPDGCDSC